MNEKRGGVNPQKYRDTFLPKQIYNQTYSKKNLIDWPQTHPGNNIHYSQTTPESANTSTRSSTCCKPSNYARVIAVMPIKTAISGIRAVAPNCHAIIVIFREEQDKG